MVDRCDALNAVWDGQPTGGRDGTAEIVQYARDREVPPWLGRHDRRRASHRHSASFSDPTLDSIERALSQILASRPRVTLTSSS